VTETVLAARSVSKRFSGRSVLASIEFELPAGSLTRLEASNGAGKSTLLRILAGVTQPDTGLIDGPARTVGYVPDRWVPPSGFSARSFLSHMGRLEAGNSATESHSVLDRLSIRPSARARLTSLSKGNAQKVLCAHAFGRHRDVLILDEPTNGLDSGALGVLTQLISEARSSGTAVLLVDHGKLPVRPDRVVELRDGVIADRVDVPDGDHQPRLTATVTVDGPVDPGVLPSSIRVAKADTGQWVIRARESDVALVLERALRHDWTVRAVDNPAGDR
jgi:ABC-type multidrug transport system ATPase subunit